MMLGKRGRSQSWNPANKRSRSNSQGQQAKPVYNRGKKKPGNVKSNKQLTASVNKLWKNKAIKQHYVDLDNATVNQTAPQVLGLTGIGAGDANNTHEGDSIRLRGLNIHGRCKVGQSGGTATINGPKTITVLVVRSLLGTGVGETPTFDMLFRDPGIDEGNFPLTQSFRTLYAESTTKVKILARRDMILEPHDTDGATTLLATYPSVMNFKIEVPVRNTKINFRPNTSTTVNQQLFLMIYCNSSGAAGDTGPRVSLSSKLTFYDEQ